MNRADQKSGRERDLKEVLFIIADGNALSQPLVRSIWDAIGQELSVRIIRPFSEGEVRGWEGVENVADQLSYRWTEKLRRFVLRSLLSGWINVIALMLPVARRMRPYFHASTIACLIPAIRRKRLNGLFIAVDSHAMLACQLAGVKAHFVSLEILHYDLAWWLCRPKMVLSCITQNPLRYLVLFPEGRVEKLVVPNFPRYRPNRQPNKSAKKGLVFAGTGFPGFGALAAIRLIAAYDDLELTFCGYVPNDVKRVIDTTLDSAVKKRIHFLTDYLDDERYIERLRGYRIGLCFYDFEGAEDGFFGPKKGLSPCSVTNYLTGFPGKIGMCVAAGVPVIASRWPGMQFVDTYVVGKSVDQLDPVTIRAAIDELESDYTRYESNAIALANSRWLENSLEPLIRRLTRDAGK
jgi:hypothetical protein